MQMTLKVCVFSAMSYKRHQNHQSTVLTVSSVQILSWLHLLMAALYTQATSNYSMVSLILTHTILMLC